MHKVLFSLLICTASCASNRAGKVEDLFVDSWQQEPQSVTQNFEKEKLTFKVDYETYFIFTADKVRKDTVCHFLTPVNKTMISSTEAPVKYDASRLTILSAASQKQEYKETLAPVNGKGPNKTRSVYCNSAISLGAYDFSFRGNELILKPVEETLKLKKYKRN